MPRRSARWMPLHVADYLADTAHLSTEEHGAYLLLIMHYWMTGRQLPDDEAQLRRIARLDARGWRRCRDAILPLFRRHETGLFHVRVERELRVADKITEMRRRAGQASGIARAGTNTCSTHVEQTGEQTGEQTTQQNGNKTPYLYNNTKKVPDRAQTLPAPSEPCIDIPKASPSAQNCAPSLDAINAAMWSAGLRVLTAAGLPERQARSLLGRWKRDRGPPAVLAALAAAQGNASPDPVAFIEGFFRDRTDRRPGRISDAFAAAARRVVADGVRGAVDADAGEPLPPAVGPRRG